MSKMKRLRCNYPSSYGSIYQQAPYLAVGTLSLRNLRAISTFVNISRQLLKIFDTSVLKLTHSRVRTTTLNFHDVRAECPFAFWDSATIPVDEDDFKDNFNTYKVL